MKIILLLSLLSSGTLGKVITEPLPSHKISAHSSRPGGLRRSEKGRRSLSSFKPLTINRFSELLRKGRRRFSVINRRLRRGGRLPAGSLSYRRGASRRKLGPTGSQLGTLAGATGAYLAFTGDQAEEIAELRKLLQRQWFKLTIAKREKRKLLSRVGTLLKNAESGVSQLEEGLDRKIDSIKVIVPFEPERQTYRDSFNYAYGDFKFKDTDRESESDLKFKDTMREYEKMNGLAKQSDFYDEAREFLDYSKSHYLKN